MRPSRTPSPPKPPGTSADKTCLVCGDRAIGYNFGVVSCESCKAFFRRNALRNEKIPCPFTGNCQINANSRRFCQPCRLRKCLAIGMNRDGLVDSLSHSASSQLPQSSQISRRRQRPVESRHVPSSKDDYESSDDSDAADLRTAQKSGNPHFVKIPRKLLNSLLANQREESVPTRCSCRCSCGFYSPNEPLTSARSSGETSLHSRQSSAQPSQQQQPIPAQILNELNWYRQHLATVITSNPICNNDFSALPSSNPAPQPSRIVALQQVVQLAAKSELSSLISNSLELARPEPQLQSASTVTLTEDQQSRLSELDAAETVLSQPLDVPLTGGALSLMQVVSITNFAMRRIILWAKSLIAFRSLDNADQIALIKGGCSELLILRGVMAFDPDRSTWNHGNHQQRELEIKLDILKATDPLHYMLHKNYLDSFPARWRQCSTVMQTLCALALFAPHRAQPISDRAKLQDAYSSYQQLLLVILEMETRSQSEARLAWDTLSQRLLDLSRLNSSLHTIYSSLDATQLDPLLRELFDIGPRPSTSSDPAPQKMCFNLQ